MMMATAIQASSKPASKPIDPTTIRIAAGIIFVILVIIIIMRRKRMASKRKPMP